MFTQIIWVLFIESTVVAQNKRVRWRHGLRRRAFVVGPAGGVAKKSNNYGLERYDATIYQKRNPAGLSILRSSAESLTVNVGQPPHQAAPRLRRVSKAIVITPDAFDFYHGTRGNRASLHARG